MKNGTPSQRHEAIFEAHGGERLDARVRGDARLAPVTAELTAHEALGVERLDAPEDLHLLVADRLRVGRDRRLHGEEAHDLEHVVLDHVPDRARLLVELPAPLDTELLGHRDLDTAHVAAVPDRLEERVGEAEEQQVLDGLLAEIMVDPEDRALGKDTMQRLVQRARRRQIPPEGLLDHHAGLCAQPEPPRPTTTVGNALGGIAR